jgi:hypothetical protein
MDYEDLIEDESEPNTPSPEDGEPSPEEEMADERVEPRARSPWKAFILTGVIASLFGAAGGGYGVYEGVKRLGPQTASQPAIDMSPLESQIEDLKARIAKAETSAKNAVNQPAPEMKPVDLSPLEARLKILESAPVPDIDPEALKALQSAQSDGFEWPDTSALTERLAVLETTLETSPEPAEIPPDLLERLDALETRLQSTGAGEGLETAASEEEMSILSERLNLIESRLAGLETQPIAAPRIERIALLPFPKAEMIAAVEDSVEGGILKRALSKHIRVKDEGDPLTLIDEIEADITGDRLEDAVKKYDRLPAPVRAVGQGWYNSVKASL